MGARPKHLVIDGVHYASQEEAARAYGVHPSVLALRLSHGVPPELLGFHGQLYKGRGFTHDGVLYANMRVFIEKHGLDYDLTYQRLRYGWTLDEVLLDALPHGYRRNGDPAAPSVPVTINGKRYHSLNAASKAAGGASSLYANRIRRLGMERALSMPLRAFKGFKCTVCGTEYPSMHACGRALKINRKTLCRLIDDGFVECVRDDYFCQSRVAYDGKAVDISWWYDRKATRNGMDTNHLTNDQYSYYCYGVQTWNEDDFFDRLDRDLRFMRHKEKTRRGKR